MKHIYLVRNQYSGEIYGIYSTFELAEENSKLVSNSYVDTQSLDVPIIPE